MKSLSKKFFIIAIYHTHLYACENPRADTHLHKKIIKTQNITDVSDLYTNSLKKLDKDTQNLQKSIEKTSIDTNAINKKIQDLKSENIKLHSCIKNHIELCNKNNISQTNKDEEKNLINNKKFESIKETLQNLSDSIKKNEIDNNTNIKKLTNCLDILPTNLQNELTTQINQEIMTEFEEKQESLKENLNKILKEEIGKIEESIKKLEETYKSDVSSLEKKIKNLKETLENLEKEIKTQKENLNTQIKRENQFSQKIDFLLHNGNFILVIPKKEVEINETKKLKNFDQENLINTEELNNLSDIQKKLLTSNQELQSYIEEKIKTIDNKNSTLETTLSTYQKKLTELENKISSQDKEIKTINSDFISLTKQNSRFNESITNTIDEFTDFFKSRNI